MHSSLFCHLLQIWLNLMGPLVFCLIDQNWERKRERETEWCGEGGGVGWGRERLKWEETFDKFQIVPYTSTLFTTLYVGQGQILFFFFFKVHIIVLSNQRKKNWSKADSVGMNAWVSISEFLLTNKLRAVLKYSCYFSTSFIRINTKSGNKMTFINKLRL